MGKGEIRTVPDVSCPVDGCTEKLIAPGTRIGSISSCDTHGLMVLSVTGYWKPLIPDTDDTKVEMTCATV